MLWLPSKRLWRSLCFGLWESPSMHEVIFVRAPSTSQQLRASFVPIVNVWAFTRIIPLAFAEPRLLA